MGMALLWLASWPGLAPPPPAGTCWARDPNATTPAPIRRKPTRCVHEAICRGLWPCSGFVSSSNSLAGMTLLLSCGSLLLAGDLAQFGQCLLSPAQVRFQLQLPEARCHFPIWRVWKLLLGAHRVSGLRELLHQRPRPLDHPSHVSNQDFRWNLCAEEQLQQQFIARNLRLRLNCQPGRQSLASGPRDRVDVPVRLALLPFGLRGDETLSRQGFQIWIDLPIALVPEKAHRFADGLPQIVARHGRDRQQAKKHVHARTCTFCHMANIYISIRAILSIVRPKPSVSWRCGKLGRQTGVTRTCNALPFLVTYGVSSALSRWFGDYTSFWLVNGRGYSGFTPGAPRVHGRVPP